MATLRDAAIQVLAEATGPLSVEEITQRALELGILGSTSKTPAASMGAALYIDLKRNPDSPFVQSGPMQFAVKPGRKATSSKSTPPPDRGLDDEVAVQNQRVKERLLGALKEMHPKAFEHLMARLLERLGYEGVEVTPYSGDGGLDVKATLTVGGVTSVPTAVQVKRYDANVSGKVVRELRGGIGVHERGLIITTGGFTKDAITEASSANKVPISLVDGRKLVDLLVQKRLGVVGRTVEVLDLDLNSLQVQEGEPVSGSGGKYATMWPLPGGDYLVALNAMVEHVGSESPTMDAMVYWINVQWSTNIQSKYRLEWLRTLGVAERRSDGRWTAVAW